MKILFTVSSLDPAAGGPSRSVPQLSLALAERRHKVGLWAPSGAGIEKLEIDVAPEEMGKVSQPADSRLNKSTDQSFRRQVLGPLEVFSGSFERALEVFGRPDICHDHGIWLQCHRRVASACSDKEIPRVVSPRGMLEPWALNYKKWKKRLAWWLYQKRDLQAAAGLHATARQEAEQLKKLGLQPPIVIAANGVGVSSFGCSNSSSKKGRKTALFLSRIHPKKGLPMLIQAWSKVQPEGWNMRVVGPDEGGHRRELEDQVSAVGMSDQWQFEDSLEGAEKFKAMAEADLFILPSHSENFGIVVAESLSCQTPVITTTGTPWAGLREHDCGWWVEPKVKDLEEALKVATSKSCQEREEMGKRGLDWVRSDFSWSSIAKTVEEFYEGVLASTE